MVVVIVFFISNPFAFHQTERIASSHQWIQHTHESMAAINRILLNLMNVESTSRGYVITGDTSFIDDIDENIKKVFNSYTLAKSLTVDNAEQQLLLNKLEPLLKERISLIKKTINYKSEKKLSETVAIPLITQAQSLTNNIRTIIEQLLQNEVSILQLREVLFLKSFKSTVLFSTAIDIFNLIILAFIILYFNIMFNHLVRVKNAADQSESLLKGIINGAQEYIVAIDLNYNFIAYNNAFVSEFRHNFGKQPAIGMNLKDALKHLPQEQSKSLEIWQRALQGEEFSIVREFGSEAHRTTQYELTFSPIYNDQNQLIGAAQIARDIGARIREELKLKSFNEKLETSLHNVEDQAKEMAMVNDMNIRLRSCSTLDETLSITSLYLKKLFPNTAGTLFIMNHSRNFLEGLTGWNSPQTTETVFAPEDCWGLRQGKIYLYINKEESIPCKHCGKESDLHSYFCIPLLALNEVVGVLNIQLKHSRSQEDIYNFQKKNFTLIQNIAGQIALSISNIKLHESLKVRSNRDVLTNLYNRTYLDETFERDLQRARRKQLSIGTVMMDLDLFKNINDKFGHEAGDIVLKEVARTITNQLRQGDIACRYGGEEFLMILYDTTVEDARKKVEQFRDAISKLEFRFIDLVTITASFGLAMFPEDGTDAQELIKAADGALYHSKKSGRNKVTVYKDIRNTL